MLVNLKKDLGIETSHGTEKGTFMVSARIRNKSRTKIRTTKGSRNLQPIDRVGQMKTLSHIRDIKNLLHITNELHYHSMFNPCIRRVSVFLHNWNH